MNSLSTLAVLAFASVALADVYLHNPRGSNNRLNERSANRNNGNRMFDSQNNNRGGYNKGDVSDQAAGGAQAKQYDMVYYQSDPTVSTTLGQLDQTTDGNGRTVLSVEWTNQHGCGGNEHGDPHKLNCQIVLQYMCVDAQKLGPRKDQEMDPANGPVDGFRDYCDMECLIPNIANPECAPATAAMPACGLSEIDNPGFCTGRGYKWVPAQVNDQYNCPHQCNGATAVNKPACEAAGGAWTTQYTNGGASVRRRFRDGTTTNRQEFTNPNNAQETQAARANRKRGNVQPDRGLHESWEWYDECYRRERNKGLFTADQNLRNNNLGYSSAVYTRQNPNNNRRGYECPEERDHYPYWHPSPWRDAAILTDRLDQCEWYRQESQNVKSKHLCRNTANCPNCVRHNTEEACKTNNGNWVEVGPHNIAPPVCEQAPWSRVNHLGNGRFGQANTFNWTIPSFSKFTPQAAGGFAATQFRQQCVFRLRYNISTDDYDAWRVNNTFNQNNGQGIKSPVQQNPAVDVGTVNTALRLAINTAQFGRTFQDRSHVLTFEDRPVTTGQNDEKCAFATQHGQTPCTAGQWLFKDKKIHNLNVRGKRCNIVQCFPSVEYDFAPNHLHIGTEDLVHIQWTGSNTHNNGNPAGDGQAGDAGEGRRGTDRHNLVELRSRDGTDFGGSFPVTWEENTMFKSMVNVYAPDSPYTCDHNKAECAGVVSPASPAMKTCISPTMTPAQRTACWDEVKQSWAVRMATAGHYNGFNADAIGAGNGGYEAAKRPTNAADQFENNDEAVQELLNNAPASFPGAVMQFKRGTYNYMNTRNHNFSNRDQKGHLIVA